LYEAGRYGGALYLARVAVQIIRSPAVALAAADAAAPAARLRHTFVKGLLTNLLVAAALLFGSVLLPQLVARGGAPVIALMAVLGAVLVR
ncbi:LysE family transporter, partial [Burkholderia pseudomallei]|uniref:LysE family transporter n=1 Tax=Burkholderia pseudomallei TaxID=28450 RepID=UPI00158E9F79